MKIRWSNKKFRSCRNISIPTRFRNSFSKKKAQGMQCPNDFFFTFFYKKNSFFWKNSCGSVFRESIMIGGCFLRYGYMMGKFLNFMRRRQWMSKERGFFDEMLYSLGGVKNANRCFFCRTSFLLVTNFFHSSNPGKFFIYSAFWVELSGALSISTRTKEFPNWRRFSESNFSNSWSPPFNRVSPPPHFASFLKIGSIFRRKIFWSKRKFKEIFQELKFDGPLKELGWKEWNPAKHPFYCKNPFYWHTTFQKKWKIFLPRRRREEIFFYFLGGRSPPGP